MNNVAEVKLGIVAVSRDCFPMELSANRRAAVVKAYKNLKSDIYECPTTVENETDMRKALKEVNEAGCNALIVYLGILDLRHQRPCWQRSSMVRSCLRQQQKRLGTTLLMAVEMLTAEC